MRVLIIGSEGFIGAHLVRYFKQYDLYTADISIVNHDNHFVISSSAPDFDTLFTKVKPDLCINASGAADVAASIKNPDHDFQLNVENVELILDAILKKSTNTKLINISSAAVYGNPANLPVFDNGKTPLNPISPYGKHKLKAEKLMLDYALNYGLKTLSLRVFSCYGPGQRKLLLWDLFTRAKATNFKHVSLFGTGQESRDYIHVEDLVMALSVCAQHAVFDGKALNVANGQETTIAEVVSKACSEIHPDLKPIFSGIERTGDPLRWKADISALLSFGYKPKFSLDEGLKDYFEWVKTTQI